MKLIIKKTIILFFFVYFGLYVFCNENEMKNGIKEYNSGNYKSAIDYFMSVLATDPKNEKAKKYIKKSADKVLEPERKTIEKERLKLMGEARGALNEQKKQNAIRDKKIKPLFKSAKKYYDKKNFLKATDKFKEIILQYPDYDMAEKYYEKILNDMNSISKEMQTSDLERLSYALGYVSYYKQKLSDAVNEWEKVLQLNPKRDELNEYIIKVKDYLKNSEQLAKEKEIEERVKRFFAEGISNFEKKSWVPCIKKMENVQNICRTEPFPQSLEWHGKAQEYITKSVEELSKIAVRPEKSAVSAKPVEAEVEIDIAGAEKKYSEGLVLYAQGKLFEAVKKWEVAIRMYPDHEKARRALDKAKKELELQKK